MPLDRRVAFDSVAIVIASLFRPHRVLVVDDVIDGADITALVLEQAGHIVRVAYNGVEALHVAERFVPDVALLDISMPGMDGLELAVALHAMPGLESCKLVALTALNDPKARAQIAVAGFSEHLVKPAGAELVLRAVQDRD